MNKTLLLIAAAVAIVLIVRRRRARPGDAGGSPFGVGTVDPGIAV